MAEYGLRLTDTSNNKLTLTPDVGTIISAGKVSMPNSLEGDNTYGIDIDLPGEGSYPAGDIVVLVVPGRPNFNSVYLHTTYGGNFSGGFHYADDEATYYTRNDSTGAMTSWSAGAMTHNQQATFDIIYSIFPLAFWDKMGDETFTSVRLFAATCYLLRDASASGTPVDPKLGTSIKTYSIGDNGVVSVDYVVAIKKGT